MYVTLKKMPLIIVLILDQEMIIMEILYRGRPFILEDAGDRYRLTSVEKKNGRVTILEFIKEEVLEAISSIKLDAFNQEKDVF